MPPLKYTQPMIDLSWLYTLSLLPLKLYSALAMEYAEGPLLFIPRHSNLSAPSNTLARNWLIDSPVKIVMGRVGGGWLPYPTASGTGSEGWNLKRIEIYDKESWWFKGLTRGPGLVLEWR